MWVKIYWLGWGSDASCCQKPCFWRLKNQAWQKMSVLKKLCLEEEVTKKSVEKVDVWFQEHEMLPILSWGICKKNALEKITEKINRCSLYRCVGICGDMCKGQEFRMLWLWMRYFHHKVMNNLSVTGYFMNCLVPACPQARQAIASAAFNRLARRVSWCH